MKAIVDIECKDPLTILNALKPDTKDSKKFVASLRTRKNRIVLTVESNDISSLLAGINSYARLIKASMGAMEI